MYHRGVDSVSGFVLAGGKSSRMGQDKASMQFGGRTLLTHALQLVMSAAGSAQIVGSAAKLAAFGPVIEDMYPGQGPLAGIHAALAGTRAELNLIVAVDMPFLEPELLSYLVAQARRTTALVVVPAAGGGLQPLCAVYRQALAGIAERSLRAGENKIDKLFSQVETRVIELEDLERNGFTEGMFRNLNTAQDWQEAKLKLSTP